VALLAGSLIAGCGSGASGSLPNAHSAVGVRPAFGSAVASRSLRPWGQQKIGSDWTFHLRSVAIDEKTKIVYVLDQDVKKIDPVTGAVITVASGFQNALTIAVDSSTHIVYVVDAGDGTIKAVHPNGTISTAATGFDRPLGLTVNPNNHILYVSDYGTHKVWEVPPGQRPQVAIAKGLNAYGLSLNPDSGEVYASDPDLNSVFIINRNDAVIPIGSGWRGPLGVTFDVHTHHLYVATIGDGVWDLAPGGSKTLVGSDLKGTQYVSVDPGTNRLYVSDVLEKAVYRITKAASEKIPFNFYVAESGISLQSIAFDPGTRDLFVAGLTGPGGAVIRVFPDGNANAWLYGLPDTCLLAVDSSTHDLYCLTQLRGVILKVTNGHTTTVGGNFANPSAFAIDPGTHDFYVGYSDRVDKVAPNGTSTPFEKGFSPAGIVVDPRTHSVYVSDRSVVRRYAPDGSVAEHIDNLGYPGLLAFDRVTNTLYVQTLGNVKTLSADRKVETIGTNFGIIVGLAVDQLDGTAYEADLGAVIWKFTP
jgi:sugar lactone lactonase YvrE